MTKKNFQTNFRGFPRGTQQPLIEDIFAVSSYPHPFSLSSLRLNTDFEFSRRPNPSVGDIGHARRWIPLRGYAVCIKLLPPATADPSLSKLSRSFPATTSRRYLCNSIKHSSGPSCVSGRICHDNGRLLLNVSSFCEFINHRVTPMFCYPSGEYKIFPRLGITYFLLFYLLCFTTIAKLYFATLRYFFFIIFCFHQTNFIETIAINKTKFSQIWGSNRFRYFFVLLLINPLFSPYFRLSQ